MQLGVAPLGRVGAGKQLLVRVLDDENVLDRRALAEPLEQRHEAAVDDHRPVAGVRGDVCEVVRVQPEVQGVQDEAAAGNAEVRLEMLVVVPAERRDAVTALETGALQRDRELPRAARHVGVRVVVEALVG